VHIFGLLNPDHLVQNWGYLAIFLLSVGQSCCIPTSSELTLGFAGVLAAEGKLSLPGGIVAGVVGELVGAYIAWAIGRAGGRPFVNRWGKYVLVSKTDLDRAEAWYNRHGPWGVFVSRLLPFIRNFVALPAGIAEVPALRFGLLTLAGSAVWDTAMALIGYGVGSQWNSVMKGFRDAGYVLAALVVVGLVFVIWHRFRSYKAHTAMERSGGGSGGRAYAGRHAADATRPVPAVPGGPPARSLGAGHVRTIRADGTDNSAALGAPVAGEELAGS
jgi:membrane protein DedA with SNARE-associated domain